MEGGDIMKKVVKCLLLFTLCSLLLFSSTAFADSLNIEKVTSNVYGLLFKIGVILAVCLTATLAISYMVATPNKKAMLKERLIYYFAGVIFLVGGLAFLNIYEGVSDDIGDTVYTDGAPSKIKGYFQNQSTNSAPSTITKVHDDDERAVTLNDLVYDYSKADIDSMNYEALKSYANQLATAKSDFTKALNFEQEGGHLSGQDKLLEDAESKLNYAKARLSKLYYN